MSSRFPERNHPQVDDNVHVPVFVFFLQELLEKLSKGELPKNEYQCMNEPGPTTSGANGAAPSLSARTGQTTNPHSMRSRRTATWARPRLSDDGYSR